MKSALLAAIFGITGGVTILLAIPAEEKASIVRIHPEWTFEYGAPEVPQAEVVPLEEEVGVPEPLEHYSVAQAQTKTEKQASRRQRHIARARPNFFEKLVIGFINLQKHQKAKSFRKRSRTTPAAPLSKKRSPRTSERFDTRSTRHGKDSR
jgi:hypothetical protein